MDGLGPSLRGQPRSGSPDSKGPAGEGLEGWGAPISFVGLATIRLPGPLKAGRPQARAGLAQPHTYPQWKRKGSDWRMIRCDTTSALSARYSYGSNFPVGSGRSSIASP